MRQGSPPQTTLFTSAYPGGPFTQVGLAKATFCAPLQRTSEVSYFSVCSKCQQEHFRSANGAAKRTRLFRLTSSSDDLKYDIIQRAVDEVDDAKMDRDRSNARPYLSNSASEGNQTVWPREWLRTAFTRPGKPDQSLRHRNFN